MGGAEQRRRDPRHAFGQAAERAAERHLTRLGYRVLARNVRTARGELDLVALHGETLVFGEVKARRGGGAGSPGEAIHPAKQGRLLQLAEAWLAHNPQWAAMACRFDAVLVERQGWRWRVTVVPDAFRPGW